MKKEKIEINIEDLNVENMQYSKYQNVVLICELIYWKK